MILCYYSCKLCGVINKAISIQDRKENQDIKDYVENVIVRTIYNEHRMQFPFCQNKVIDELKIPASNEKGIGFPLAN